MNYDENALEGFFDIGDVEGYQPPKEDGFPVLEASKPVWTPGPDGKRIRRDDPIYLFKVTGPCKSGKDRFGDNALVGRALSVHPAKTEPRRRVSLPLELPQFRKAEQIRADVLADDRVSETLKEERIQQKIGGLGRAKGRAMLLAKALVGSDDVRALNAYLQSPDVEGAIFGAAVSVRGYCRTCKQKEQGCGCAEEHKEIVRNNDFTRFYPASGATERMPE